VKRLVAAAACIVSAVPVAALAATPSPDLTVLRTTLAGAPDNSWLEAGQRPGILEGTFDAVDYVNTEWTDDQAVRDSVRNQLLTDDFIGGYGRSFYKGTPRDWIVEDVKAFPDGVRAMSFWAWSKDYFHDPDNASTIVDNPSVPNSFGDEYSFDSGWHGIDIYFAKANYVFTVTVGSYSAYRSDEAKAQAVAVYSFAPSQNVLPLSAQQVSTRLSARPALAVLEGIALAVGLIVLVSMVLLLVLTMRRRPVVSPQSALSPDGNYWWDGSRWQPRSRP
jgi:hypothetical protein